MVSDSPRERYWLEFDISSSDLVSANTASLNTNVYYTSANVVQKGIQAWYCDGVGFDEKTLTWNTQPIGWDQKTGAKLKGNNCVLVDTFYPTQRVVAAYPYPPVYDPVTHIALYADQHKWNLKNIIDSELSGDGKFTIVIKYQAEYLPAGTTKHWAQYLTEEYTDASFKPRLVLG
jgi:hypothetical protein